MNHPECNFYEENFFLFNLNESDLCQKAFQSSPTTSDLNKLNK